MNEKTIAWIDDDAALIHQVLRPLERSGYQIQNYRTPLEVWNAVDEIMEAKVIVLDLLLPPGRGKELAMNEEAVGLTLLRQLSKRHESLPPVVVLSVVVNDEVESQLKSLGVADIISKPADPFDVATRVESAIQSREQLSGG